MITMNLQVKAGAEVAITIKMNLPPEARKKDVLEATMNLQHVKNEANNSEILMSLHTEAPNEAGSIIQMSLPQEVNEQNVLM